jgi:hypothetical protein
MAAGVSSQQPPVAAATASVPDYAIEQRRFYERTTRDRPNRLVEDVGDIALMETGRWQTALVSNDHRLRSSGS